MDQNNEPSRIKFEEKRQQPTRILYFGESKIIRWTIKCSGGYIKNEKQASYVILGFVALAIIVSLFLIFGGGHTQRKPPPALLEQMKQMHVNQ